ncbi:MAG: hypothetical protein NHB14_12815 [Desulfosporosinus sp.]|nr:hypothetical protein [Desulfosporosinus sp.]
MSNREVASLACKILSIYMIIQGINVSTNVLSFAVAMSHQMTRENLLNISYPLMYILFGVLLWLLSSKLSVVIVKKETHFNDGIRISASDIQRIAFSVLGLFFVGNSLPRLVSVIVIFYTKSSRGINISTAEILLGAGGDITQLIVGLWIFLSSKGLVNFLKAIRTAGLKKEEED